MTTNITVSAEQVANFCRHHKILKMALFGSVGRQDFTAQSDVDVLVEFAPDARVGLITLSGMELELSELLGRRAELHTMKGLNPQFRDDVIATAKVVYE